MFNNRGMTQMINPNWSPILKKNKTTTGGVIAVNLLQSIQNIAISSYEIVNWFGKQNNVAYLMLSLMIYIMPIQFIRPRILTKSLNLIVEAWGANRKVRRSSIFDSLEIMVLTSLVTISVMIHYSDLFVSNYVSDSQIRNFQFIKNHSKIKSIILSNYRNMPDLPYSDIILAAYQRYELKPLSEKRAKEFTEFKNYRFIGRPTIMPNSVTPTNIAQYPYHSNLITHLGKLAPATILKIGLKELRKTGLKYCNAPILDVPYVNLTDVLAALYSSKVYHLVNLSPELAHSNGQKIKKSLFIKKLLEPVKYGFSLRQNYGISMRKKYLLEPDRVFLPGIRNDWIAYLNSDGVTQPIKKAKKQSYKLQPIKIIESAYQMVNQAQRHHVPKITRLGYKNLKIETVGEYLTKNKILDNPIAEALLNNPGNFETFIMSKNQEFVRSLNPLYTTNDRHNTLGNASILTYAFGVANKFIHSLIDIKVVESQGVTVIYGKSNSEPLVGPLEYRINKQIKFLDIFKGLEIADSHGYKASFEKYLTPVTANLDYTNFTVHRIPGYQFKIGYATCITGVAALYVTIKMLWLLTSSTLVMQYLNFPIFKNKIKILICILELIIGNQLSPRKYLAYIIPLSPVAYCVHNFKLDTRWLNFSTISRLIIPYVFKPRIMQILTIFYIWAGPTSPLRLSFYTIYYGVKTLITLPRILHTEYRNFAVKLISGARANFQSLNPNMPLVIGCLVMRELLTNNLFNLHINTNRLNICTIFIRLPVAIAGAITRGPISLLRYVKYLMLQLTQIDKSQLQSEILFTPLWYGQVDSSNLQNYAGITNFYYMDSNCLVLFQLLWVAYHGITWNYLENSILQSSGLVLFRQFIYTIMISGVFTIIFLSLPLNQSLGLFQIFTSMYLMVVGPIIAVYYTALSSPPQHIADWIITLCRFSALALIPAPLYNYPEEYLLILPALLGHTHLTVLIVGKFIITKLFNFAYSVMGTPGLNYINLNGRIYLTTASGNPGYSKLCYDILALVISTRVLNRKKISNIGQIIPIAILYVLQRLLFYSFDPHALLGYRLSQHDVTNDYYSFTRPSSVRNRLINLNIMELLSAPTISISLWVIAQIVLSLCGIEIPGLYQGVNRYQKYLKNSKDMDARINSISWQTLKNGLTSEIKWWQDRMLYTVKHIGGEKENLYNYNKNFATNILKFGYVIIKLFQRVAKKPGELIYAIVSNLVAIFEYFFDSKQDSVAYVSISNISKLNIILLIWIAINLSHSNIGIESVCEIECAHLVINILGKDHLGREKQINAISMNVMPRLRNPVMSEQPKKLKPRMARHNANSMPLLPQLCTPLNSVKIESYPLKYFLMTVAGWTNFKNRYIINPTYLFGGTPEGLPGPIEYGLKTAISKITMAYLVFGLLASIYRIQPSQAVKFISGFTLVIIWIQLVLKNHVKLQ